MGGERRGKKKDGKTNCNIPKQKTLHHIKTITRTGRKNKTVVEPLSHCQFDFLLWKRNIPITQGEHNFFRSRNKEERHLES